MKNYREFVWQRALDYLNTRADMRMVQQHMSLYSISRLGSFSEVYLRLLQSLSNRQGMPNTIGSIESLSAVFCEFNHLQILKRYSDNWEGLFETIQREVQPESRMDKTNPHSYWVIFSKGSISGAEYLARFDALEDFLQYVKDFDERPTTRPALPFLMGHEIFGYGFSLTCDFLKELGFSNYAKPDTHLIDIFSGLGVSSKSPLDVFKAVSLMAHEVGETPYAVDKAFWLIGSGKLYLNNVTFRTNKSEFIEEAKNEWQKMNRA